MGTIRNEIQLESVALMTGISSKVKLFPSEKSGIRFYLGGESVEAKVENVISTDHCTVLGSENIKVMLVEHLMAACAFCRIDALDVHLEHFELPVFDGSAKRWVEAFQEVGFEPSEKSVTALKEPVIYQNGKTHVVVLPDEQFSLTYGVNFENVDLRNRWVDYKEDSEVIEARTFGYLKDLEKLQQAGFAKGVSLENTVGITADGYTVDLRSEFEPIKHKMLDLIGDFYLTGVNPFDLKARIIAKEAGHAVHVNVAKQLVDSVTKE